MNPLEAVYHFFYARRKSGAESARIAFPSARIISVGNLTTGGTGKTPVVQWLAKSFENKGVKTAIVARGYGGEFSLRGAVVHDGEKILLNARQAGDEAILHARSLHRTPVVIGRDRVAAVQTAIEKFAPQVILLDDGFQYWSLARDFDLVLLDARRPFGNGKLLPIGRLREPPGELKRAKGVLLTRADEASESELKRAADAVRRYADAPIFHASHAPVCLRDEASGERMELENLLSHRVAVLSALAHNAGFLQSLKARGAQAGSTLARRDHHQWREKEVRDFAREAKRNGAQAIVTTEKDAVKLHHDWCESLPLWSLVIEAKIENEEELWRLIQQS